MYPSAPMTSSSSSPLRRVCLISLGCPKNLVDSETMLGSLPREEFRPTVRMEEADVVVVNTCAFLGSARREARAEFRKAARWKREKGGILAVAGCLVQYYGERAKEMFPAADILLGAGEGGGVFIPC